jgi:hypothetical protein
MFIKNTLFIRFQSNYLEVVQYDDKINNNQLNQGLSQITSAVFWPSPIQNSGFCDFLKPPARRRIFHAGYRPGRLETRMEYARWRHAV